MRKKFRVSAQFLADRDGGWFCHYCHAPVTPYPPDATIVWVPLGTKLEPGHVNGHELASIDHKIPRNQGGSHDADNLVLCCHRCNCRKNEHRTYAEYYAMTAAMRAAIAALEATS